MAARGASTGGRRGGKRAKGPTCDDCFFRARMLCALDLDAPCSTFRPDRPEGLVPPRQPALLVRDPEGSPAATLRPAA
jgi:hypothetical protein